jgi:hypothetical protein
MIGRTWLPIALSVSAAAALFWTTHSSGPTPVTIGRSLTPQEQELAVGQSGCTLNMIGQNNLGCIIGATTCAPATFCCFATPVNQATACPGELQYIGGVLSRWGNWTSIACTGTRTTAPCECKFINRCRPGTAATVNCGNRPWYAFC